MTRNRIVLGMAALIVFAAYSSNALSQSMEGQGQAIVTVVPSHAGEQAIQVSQQDIKELKVDGKASQVIGWTPLRDQPLELVLLIDSGARTSLGTQLNEINSFVQELPPHTQMAIAWMENGRAAFAGPLSSNPGQILNALHLPTGPSGANASPYFSLSALAKQWPSQNRGARREVVMVTDGIDDYNPHYDPEDPYVQTAINDSVRSGIVVYALYWKDQGRLDRFGWAQDAGQNLLLNVTQATGGTDFWEGFGNPVSFQPYFKDLRQRLSNQYALSFTAPVGSKPSIERFDLKISVPAAKVDSPKQVLVQPTAQAQR